MKRIKIKKIKIETLKRKILTKIRDPRRQYGNILHKLWEMLVIGLCSVICLGEDYDDMEEFGKEREKWLKEELGPGQEHLLLAKNHGKQDIRVEGSSVTLAFSADIAQIGMGNQIKREFVKNIQVERCIIFLDQITVLTKNYIKRPVQFILNSPMLPDSMGKFVDIR